ncbi:unnamed protein product [Bursaphelenchus xylophilus]|uniref:Innexin n=1 Tax=Bursaphelenchus xylophilus TaxID=6326 RepID=A0A1I7SGE4_BURXY|nr:unnamed protein product [Bursaphelenchus xylophilus]CAG9083576.1 unnamed protein product [Bursaphelenchus xylophilus]
MDLLIGFVEGFLKPRNEEDAFDRLNYQVTPFLFILFSLVNISKVYIGKAINCFAKAEFRGGWVEYAHDYCLIENTYYLRTNESIPIEQELRGEKQINYYQWVPFILVLQACSFYIPHLMWRSFNWITGYQIRAVMSAAKQSYTQSVEESRDVALKISRSLFYASQLKHKTLRILNEQIFVTVLYLSMKFCYLCLILIHLGIFKLFIGSLDFAFGIVQQPGEWEQTGFFPRVTVCDFTILRYGQPMNYTLECVLPLNMFNEKIFVFFYFWLILLFGTTVFSILLWIQRLVDRKAFYKRLLDLYQKNDRSERSSPDNEVLLLQTLKSSPKPDEIDFGYDLRVVLGLLQDHSGLLFSANVFHEMVNLKLSDHRLSTGH